MKLSKILSAFTTISLCAAVFPENSAFADAEYTEGVFESLTYQKYSDHIVISKCDKSAVDVDIPPEIEGLPVTEIGKNAFSFCYDLTDLTIPDSVTLLNEFSFRGCTNLVNIEIPDSVTQIGNAIFYNCESLESITIPESITEISGGTFCNCMSLTSVTLPDSVTKIDGSVFSGCSSLKNIHIPDSVTSISSYAFQSCSSLTELTIPESVTFIGEIGTFSECSSLTEIKLPSNIQKIGEKAFSGCYKLTEITIPENVTSIGNCAFLMINGSSTPVSVGDDTSQGSSSPAEITILSPNCEIYDSSDTICNGYDENIGSYYNGIIRSYENSTAQAYAEKYGYTFESMGVSPENPAFSVGDVNCDGIIDANDASKILAIYSVHSTGGTPDEPAEQLKLADVNGDNMTDSTDASVVLAYYAYVSTGGTDSIKSFINNLQEV